MAAGMPSTRPPATAPERHSDTVHRRSDVDGASPTVSSAIRTRDASRPYAGHMTDAALIGPVAPPDLHVMTYNIRRRAPPRPAGQSRPVGHRAGRSSDASSPPSSRRSSACRRRLPTRSTFVARRPRPALPLGRARSQSIRPRRALPDLLRCRAAGAHRVAAARPVGDAGAWPGRDRGATSTRRVVVSADVHRSRDRGTAARIEHPFRSPLVAVEARIRATYIVRRSRGRGVAAEPDAAIVVAGDFNADVDSAVYRRLTAERRAPGRVGGGGRAPDAAVGHLLELPAPPAGRQAHRPHPRRARGRRASARASTRCGSTAAAASDHEPVQAVLRSRRSAARRRPSSLLRMMRGVPAAPEGVAEVVADALRVLAAVSHRRRRRRMGPALGAEPRRSCVGAMLVPRAAGPPTGVRHRVRHRGHSLPPGAACSGSTSRRAGGTFRSHFLTNGLYAALLLHRARAARRPRRTRDGSRIRCSRPP